MSGNVFYKPQTCVEKCCFWSWPSNGLKVSTSQVDLQSRPPKVDLAVNGLEMEANGLVDTALSFKAVNGKQKSSYDKIKTRQTALWIRP